MSQPDFEQQGSVHCRSIILYLLPEGAIEFTGQ